MRLPTQRTTTHRGYALPAFILLLWILLNPVNHDESTMESIVKTSLIGYLLSIMNFLLTQSPTPALQNAAPRMPSETDQNTREADVALWVQLAQSGLFQPTPPASPISNESNISAILDEALEKFAKDEAVIEEALDTVFSSTKN